eukprot:1254909-Rhodomonas_salina.2
MLNPLPNPIYLRRTARDLAPPYPLWPMLSPTPFYLLLYMLRHLLRYLQSAIYAMLSSMLYATIFPKLYPMGGTTLLVRGRNFIDSAQLNCYFTPLVAASVIQNRRLVLLRAVDSTASLPIPMRDHAATPTPVSSYGSFPCAVPQVCSYAYPLTLACAATKPHVCSYGSFSMALLLLGYAPTNSRVWRYQAGRAARVVSEPVATVAAFISENSVTCPLPAACPDITDGKTTRSERAGGHFRANQMVFG